MLAVALGDRGPVQRREHVDGTSVVDALGVEVACQGEGQCVELCPVSCIPIHPEHVETQDDLWLKYRTLQQEKQAASPPAAD